MSSRLRDGSSRSGADRARRSGAPARPAAVGIRRGFRTAAAAGAGAASADGLYTGLAAVGGAAIAGFLEPLARTLKVTARLPLRFQVAISLLGSLVIVGFAILLARDL